MTPKNYWMNQHVNQWIANNYKELQTIVNNITHNHELGDDLLQEVMVQLYEKNEIVLHNYEDDTIKYYIIKILKINWYSKTSPFHYRVRKESSNYTELSPHLVNSTTDDMETEAKEYEELLKSVEEQFAELTWFNKRLFELYLTLGSLKRVSTQTGIPVASVGRYIREIKNEIKINVENSKNGNN